ncbi:uncharacterized protein N7511_005790 [Penicillium nucicola]|uniref:uncharacterized protein n=1 Tax=Penicillium nucicola TaxID=1850975 RepID=UPI0025453103|nr:uncharacterized protein N7511_005790 [Penicillium nucicola]KAJ5762408.1 hypothetical protein N7511_005790 [Penicillium nucicola]
MDNAAFGQTQTSQPTARIRCKGQANDADTHSMDMQMQDDRQYDMGLKSAFTADALPLATCLSARCLLRPQ